MHRKHLLLGLLSLLFVQFYACTPQKKQGQVNANTTFYIHPNTGSDGNSGLSDSKAWKSFKPLQKLVLSEGCRVEVLEAGDLNESLCLKGRGTKESPVVIRLASGEYNFYPNKALRKKFHISNTNDTPDSLKVVAFYLQNCKNVEIEGNGAEIIFRGKAMEMCLEKCEDIQIQNLNFDYKRPTVSEMKVVKVGENFADVQIHKDSDYKVENNKLIWLGEGWEHEFQSYCQAYSKKDKAVRRHGLKKEKLKFTELDNEKVRIEFTEDLGIKEGLIFQNRDVLRDYCGFFTNQSKNISWKNVNVYFMHGMGFVSQFSENISFEKVNVEPRSGSGRTCAAWADILHFSGCKGNIEIHDCILSAANDDAVNVHGTHLRIVDIMGSHKLKVRFMHPQTYGFQPFFVDDQVEFIRASTLLPYGKNTVKTVEEINAKEYVLSFENEIPQNIEANDVIENVTWTANVHMTGTMVKDIPTRGVLVTSRGKMLIENNTFFKTTMSGILLADDANSWYESGYITDLTIRKNKFIECGQPVINIHPEAKALAEEKVHQNIKIVDNEFRLKDNLLLSARSTQNLQMKHNIIVTNKKSELDELYEVKSCEEVVIKENQIK